MSFVRDSQGMIINTDDSYYEAIVAQRNSEKKAREVNLQVNELKNELSEIRTLLAQITNGNKDG